MELEMYDYTSNNWSHWNSNEKLKGKNNSKNIIIIITLIGLYFTFVLLHLTQDALCDVRHVCTSITSVVYITVKFDLLPDRKYIMCVS